MAGVLRGLAGQLGRKRLPLTPFLLPSTDSSLNLSTDEAQRVSGHGYYDRQNQRGRPAGRLRAAAGGSVSAAAGAGGGSGCCAGRHGAASYTRLKRHAAPPETLANPPLSHTLPLLYSQVSPLQPAGDAGGGGAARAPGGEAGAGGGHPHRHLQRRAGPHPHRWGVARSWPAGCGLWVASGPPSPPRPATAQLPRRAPPHAPPSVC